MAAIWASIAIVLRGDRGLEHGSCLIDYASLKITIVLRGDRGLEQVEEEFEPNEITDIAIVLRGDRGLEPFARSRGLRSPKRQLRSFFGAIEDWNLGEDSHSVGGVKIAIVLRGDRGLEPVVL